MPGKFIFLVMLVSGLAYLPATSQITIDRNDMPNTGDTIRRSMTLSVNGVNYDTTAYNLHWDFSSLSPASQQVDGFVSVSSVPFAYQLVFNNPFDPTKATIASPVETMDSLAGISLENVFTFFRETNTYYGFSGIGATVSNITLPVKYDNPDIIYRFPLTPGSSDSSTSSFSLSLAGMGYLLTSRHRVNHVDGWGTVTTPFGTFSCIRVKSSITEHDSIYIDSIAAGYSLDRAFTEYKWVTDNKGLPVIEISKEGPVTTVLYLDSLRSLLPVPQPVDGYVHYNNNNSDPASGAFVYLVSAGGDTTAQAVTDTTGYYRFNAVNPGLYTLKVNCLLPWGGGNATDALLALKHFTGMATLTGIPQIVADVDDSGYINSVDALKIAQRFVQLIDNFPSGDWYFESPAITVTGAGVTRNIAGQCFGDIDASF